MRALTKTLLAFVAGAFFLTSCGGDPTASNPDIKQMSDASKKALDDAAKVSCGCLKTNGKDLKEATTKMKPILAEAEKAENPMEVLGKMGEIMEGLKGLEAFGECMKDARPGKGDEAAEKALEEDMKKIMGEKPDFKAVSEKRRDISLAFLKKNCASEAKILEDMMKVQEDASALRKKKRDEEKK
jgi:hypothetical protein